MLPILRRVIFCLFTLFLLLLTLPKGQIYAITTGFADALSGWGTNFNQDIPIDSRLNSRSVRVSWDELEPNNDDFRFGRIFNLINDATIQNKKVTIGIQLKTRAEYSSNCPQSPCYDGSPRWVVDIDPLTGTTNNNGQQIEHRMLNYVNPEVKGHIADIVGKLTSELATRYPNNNNYAILVCSGIDCEAQPEAELDQVYLNKWGSNYENVWIDFMKWLIDTYEDKMNSAGLNSKTRYLVISANFKNYKLEKPSYVSHLLTKSNKWGLYSAGIAIGLKLYRYGEPHANNQDQILDTNYDLQDIFRKWCLVRPCLGEHGDAYEAGTQYENKEWMHWWRAAAALWYRADGFYTTKSWALDYGQLARNFFRDYWGKTFSDTPKAWVILHEDHRDNPSGSGYPQRNFTFYLDQFDATSVDGKGAQTVPEWSGFVSGYNIGNLNPTDDYRGIFTRRTNRGVMAFRVVSDAAGNYYIKDGPHIVKFEITYLDHGTDTLTLKYASLNGVKDALSITKTNSNTWKTSQSNNIDDAVFSRTIPGEADFYIDDNNNGDEYIHMVNLEYLGTPISDTSKPTFSVLQQGSISIQNVSGISAEFVSNQQFSVNANPAQSVSGQYKLTTTLIPNTNYQVLGANTTVTLSSATSTNVRVNISSPSQSGLPPSISPTNVPTGSSPTPILTSSITPPTTITTTPGVNIGAIISSAGSPMGIILIVGILLLIDLFMKPDKLF